MERSLEKAIWDEVGSVDKVSVWHNVNELDGRSEGPNKFGSHSPWGSMALF